MQASIENSISDHIASRVMTQAAVDKPRES
jgi:hypothetical protein